MANHAASQDGPAKFKELKDKISGGLQIQDGCNYLLFVKKGALPDSAKAMFLDLWRRNFSKSFVILTELENPEKDVIALEIPSLIAKAEAAVKA